MIERYALSPIKDLWTLKNQYHRWLKVELAVVKAFEEEGIAPVGTADEIEKLAKIDVDNILDIESVVDHDVIAFIKSVTEPMGDCARYFHMGLTSSDVVDTGLAREFDTFKYQNIAQSLEMALFFCQILPLAIDVVSVVLYNSSM